MNRSWGEQEEPELDEREGSGNEPTVSATGISNRWMAVLLFMAVEAMLFTIFIFAFLYLRTQGESWPPPGVNRLDPTVPALSLVVLLLSAVVAISAERSIRQYWITVAEKQLLLASALGLLFLLGQIREYSVLFVNGITASSLYGGLFYLTIAFHGLHVLSGVVWLLAVWYLTRAARQTPAEHFGVQAATVYWGFVSGVWIALFLLLYVL